jgi:hypothetical protein
MGQLENDLKEAQRMAAELEAQRAHLPQGFVIQLADDSFYGGQYVSSFILDPKERTQEPQWTANPDEALRADEITTGDMAAALRATGYPVRVVDLGAGGGVGQN